jgi:tRNA(fMet)-specific endonuclease VapC
MLMLDTNICIYIIKKRPTTVLKRFQSIKTEQICISVITYAELQYGVDKSSAVAKNQQIIDDFISRLSVINWDEKAAQSYGKIRSNLP